VSRNLFHQAIVQNGILWTKGVFFNFFIPKEEAEEYGMAFVKNLGLNGPDCITQMREMKPQDLMNPSYSFFSNG